VHEFLHLYKQHGARSNEQYIYIYFIVIRACSFISLIVLDSTCIFLMGL